MTAGMVPDPDLLFDDVILDRTRYSHVGATAGPVRIDDGIVDEVAVRRRFGGDTSVVLSRRELVAAVVIGVRQRMSDDEIGERLGIHKRSVLRIRVHHDIAPAVPRHSGDWGVGRSQKRWAS